MLIIDTTSKKIINKQQFWVYTNLKKEKKVEKKKDKEGKEEILRAQRKYRCNEQSNKTCPCVFFWETFIIRDSKTYF